MKSVHGTPEQLNIKTNKYKPITLTYIVTDKFVTTVIQHKLNIQGIFPKENHRTKLIQKVREERQVTRHKNLSCCNPVRHLCANVKLSKPVVEKF